MFESNRLNSHGVARRLRRHFRRRALLLAALPCVGFPTASLAGNISYTGGSGVWGDLNNWSTHILPAPNDVVTLTPASGSVTVQLDISATNLGQLTIDAVSSNFVTLLQSANSLSTQSYEIIGSNGNGALNLSGGTHSIGTQLYLGLNSGSTGQLMISAGYLAVGSDEAVANQGNATVIQSGGTHTIDGALQIGLTKFATGTFSLSGGSLVVNGGENVATVGHGQFNQSGGSHTISSALYVGSANGAVGNYSMTNGTLTVIGDEFIGNFGSGTLNQSGGTHTIFNSLSVAAFAGSSGGVNLTGGSIAVTNVNVGGSASGGGASGTITVAGGELDVSNSLKIWPTPGSGVTLNSGTLSVGGIDLSNNASAFQWNGGTLRFSGANGLLIGTGGSLGAAAVVDLGKALEVSNELTVNTAASLLINGGRLASGSLSNSGTFGIAAGLSNVGNLAGSGNNERRIWNGPCNANRLRPDAIRRDGEQRRQSQLHQHPKPVDC